MKVLFTSSPGLGHVNPMIPLATALRDRGHEVRWAIPAEFAGHLEASGFEVFAAGLGERERWPMVRRLVGAPVDGTGPPPGFTGVKAFSTLFGRVGAPRMAADLEVIVAGWAPDLFVHDMSEFAAAPLATRLGRAHVTHSWAWALPPDFVAAAAAFCANLWTDHGLEAPPDGGMFQHLYLHPYPGELAVGPTPSGHLQPIRPGAVAPRAGETVPPWVADLPDGAVYITLGTIFSDAAAMRGLVQSLVPLGRPLVVTTGPLVDPDAMGDLPPGSHVARYVPQDAILSRVALVVSHVGAGTFLGAASRGVPQLCLPAGADQFFNAKAAEASGVGIALPPDQRNPAAVLAAAHRLLDEPAFRERAAVIAAAIQAMPSADEVAPLVEALALRQQVNSRA